VVRELLVTAACVAGAFTAAMVALPPLATPPSVAQEYVRAEYEGDWDVAWHLMCHDARDLFRDLRDFSERLTAIRDYLMDPSDVDVEITDVHSTSHEKDPAVRVGYSITSNQPGHQDWTERWAINVVREKGQFRICYGGS
jgi:hypothetical protein